MNKYKYAVEDLEYYGNGYHRLCGHYVKAVNIRERKNEVIADVILIDDLGIKERYDDCHYDKSLLVAYTNYE